MSTMTTISTSGLKRCPFCGCEDVMLEYTDETEMFSVWCPICGMEGALSFTEEQTRKLWNRRVNND